MERGMIWFTIECNLSAHCMETVDCRDCRLLKTEAEASQQAIAIVLARCSWYGLRPRWQWRRFYLYFESRPYRTCWSYEKKLWVKDDFIYVFPAKRLSNPITKIISPHENSDHWPYPLHAHSSPAYITWPAFMVTSLYTHSTLLSPLSFCHFPRETPAQLLSNSLPALH